MSDSLKEIGLNHLGETFLNLPAARLIEHALARKEGILTGSGALRAQTGLRTGRSPRDKFIVEDARFLEEIWWGEVNQPFAVDRFEKLRERVAAYLQNRTVYVFDGFAGADPKYRLPVRIVTEYAWHNLFSRQLFLRPTRRELQAHSPEFVVLSVPGFLADPAVDGTRSSTFVLLSFEQRLVLIGGTEYAGEIKKSIFTVMNFLMPFRGVVPMHCSANVGSDDSVALFFGLSGTGKTTLSADPERRLVGDDEHGWSDSGVFNFEGGCYAKCISLNREKEPQIWEAIRFGAVLENVAVDEEDRVSDFDCDSVTENTRAAYPIDHIPGAMIPGVAGHPSVILFLTADAFGVLPPISRLSAEQAMYHFISGYTSKLAGTETGVTEPEATFSACFGAPFLPLHPLRYARMLGERIERHDVEVFLVNTGWTGGPYGTGRRMELSHTRAMVSAALQGQLRDARFTPHPVFQVGVPDRCPGVPDQVLEPKSTWASSESYDEKAAELAGLFRRNIAKFKGIDPAILEAGPAGP